MAHEPACAADFHLSVCGLDTSSKLLCYVADLSPAHVIKNCFALKCTQSRSGRPIANMPRARVPGFQYPDRKLPLQDRIVAVRANTLDRYLTPLRAMVKGAQRSECIRVVAIGPKA